MTRDRALRAGLAAATALSLVLGPAAATALAEPAVAADTVAERGLPLTGVVNARDAGGYRTADGRRVRTGLVLRTGALDKATDADLADLAARGVRVVEDLRTSYERIAGPDRLPEGAAGAIRDVMAQASPLAAVAALAGGADMYRGFITTPGANEAFAAVLRDIATTDGAVLYHCSAGKDRTGWTSAVLLTLLGVDRATVTEDYLLSNVFRHAAPGDVLNGVDAAWLDAAFDQVDRSYGDFDGYVRDGLGLSAAEVAALRDKLLA